ncbi:hypothetical protein IG197_16830 [Aminobacter sp. SR38]|uniref:hypothetical protein n=1 Tax=Aminobacter sp. SR38 TaxID=2774562 RepID=UPI001780B402|nr:hypothetical protein [Aminobacter sp. SR38]QOF69526.1 hypothetical protein IG197_16830 [Aminobacter sp. SR38]
MPFAVRVVEPRRLEPSNHVRLLNAVVEELLNPATVPRDRFDDATTQPAARRYDLVTFPEAFAPAEAIVAVADALRGQGPSGCLHIGLRPDSGGSNHLFTLAAAHELADRLETLVEPGLRDLSGFKSWLGRQASNKPFNLGCVLAVDADSKLRVCLHPKLVRSKFEIDRLPERHMHEANLLTLITLVPANPRFGTVTLQPLICSDALDLDTDSGLPPPIPAVTSHARCFPDPPNHVDVVSVATCTPQSEGALDGGDPYRAWHVQFLDAFRAAAERPDRARHHFSSFILSNYGEMAGKPGGLSGAFLPVSPGFPASDAEVSVSCWGRPKKSSVNNTWSTTDDDALNSWSNRGFVAGLNPFSPRAVSEARMLAFDVHRLPREASRWRTNESLVAWEVRTWVAEPDDDRLRQIGATHA